MKKLFDSGELGQPSFTSVSFSADELGRENQRQLTPTILPLRKIHEGVECFEPNRSRLESLAATKNHQGGLGDSEDQSDAKIFSVSDSETGQQSAPHIQLKLMPRQPQQA